MAARMEVKQEMPESTLEMPSSSFPMSVKIEDDGGKSMESVGEHMTYEDLKGQRDLAVVNVTRMWQKSEKEAVKYEVTLKELDGTQFVAWVDFDCFVDAPKSLAKFYSTDPKVHYEVAQILETSGSGDAAWVKVKWSGRWKKDQVSWEMVKDMPDLSKELEKLNKKVKTKHVNEDSRLNALIDRRIKSNAVFQKASKRLQAKVRKTVDERTSIHNILKKKQ